MEQHTSDPAVIWKESISCRVILHHSDVEYCHLTKQSVMSYSLHNKNLDSCSSFKVYINNSNANIIILAQTYLLTWWGFPHLHLWKESTVSAVTFNFQQCGAAASQYPELLTYNVLKILIQKEYIILLNKADNWLMGNKSSVV